MPHTGIIAEATADINGTAPAITSTPGPGIVGVAFSYNVTASGTTPITFGASNLPPGLSITTDGVISGFPTAAGTYAPTLTASNVYGSTSQTAMILISNPATTDGQIEITFE
jgi:hypothetical protein